MGRDEPWTKKSVWQVGDEERAPRDNAHRERREHVLTDGARSQGEGVSD